MCPHELAYDENVQRNILSLVKISANHGILPFRFGREHSLWPIIWPVTCCVHSISIQARLQNSLAFVDKYRPLLILRKFYVTYSRPLEF